MAKPTDADYYGWADFVKWGMENGVEANGDPDDWEPWWECWKSGYISAMNK